MPKKTTGKKAAKKAPPKEFEPERAPFWTPGPLSLLDELPLTEKCPICFREVSFVLKRPEDISKTVISKYHCPCGNAFLRAAWFMKDYDWGWSVLLSPKVEQILYERYRDSGGFD